MDLIYKKADVNDIEALINLKIKQSIYNCNKNEIVLKNEKIVRKNIKKVLLQELNKTIYFFIAVDKSNNKTVASSGVIIHQMIPSILFPNGKKAYITSVYTEQDYRRKGIQKVLIKKILDFLAEIDCRKIELDAINPFAIKLYENLGFKKDNDKYILNIL